MIAKVLYVINNLCSTAGTQGIKAACHQLAQLLLLHQLAQGPLAGLLVLEIGAHLRRQDFVENHAAQGSGNKTIILGSAIFLLLKDAHLNLCLNIQLLMLISQQSLVDAGEDLALTQGTLPDFGQVVSTQNHILGRNDNRAAVLRCQDMVGCQHQHTGLSLGLRRQRQMDSHLVTIKVSVVSRASQRMQLQGTALGKNRLKSLNTQAMQRRGTVQKYRMLLDNILQYIPYFLLRTLNLALGGLDIVGDTLADQLLHNKWLKELQGHLLWQAALMQLQLRADYDNGTA